MVRRPPSVIRKNPVILESIGSQAVIDIAIEPEDKTSQDKMGDALVKLAEEDLLSKVRTDEETGQTIISGMGEETNIWILS